MNTENVELLMYKIRMAKIRLSYYKEQIYRCSNRLRDLEKELKNIEK